MKRRVCLVVLMFLLVAVSLMGSGCATVLSGTDQDILVTSEPEGVQVTADDGTSIVTPGKLKLARNSTYVLVASYEGCETQERELTKGTNGAVFGNILLGGVIGIIVDYVDGAAYSLTPGEVYFDFTEAGQAHASRRAEFVRAHPGLDKRIRLAIQSGQPQRRMTREQLYATIGEPDAVEQDGKYEVLTYSNRDPRLYYLKEDILVKTKK